MTVELEEFTEWHDSVEARLGRLEAVSDRQEDRAEYHKGLIGSMDHDLSKMQVEFRAQRSMLQALHDTQTEHTRRFTKIEGRLDGVETRLGGVETRLDGLEGRLGGVEGRLGGVEESLGSVKAGITAIQDKLDLLIGGK